MCQCDPRMVRTLYCGRPGCEMPRQGGRRSRPSVDFWLMQLAVGVSTRGACRKRSVGSVIAIDGRVLSVGYNGTPKGWQNCDEGGCPRCAEGVGAGEDYSRCLCCHAEENAIVQAARFGVAIEGGTIYTMLSPCVPCARKIVNSGIKRVVFMEKWPEGDPALKLLKGCGIEFGIVYEGEFPDGQINR